MYFAITVVLSILGWTGLARTVRSKFLALRRSTPGCQAGRRTDPPRHMLPGFASHLVVDASNRVPMILGETALSFLGVGLRPPAVSWGVLRGAQNIEAVALHPWLLPGAVIITVVAFQRRRRRRSVPVRRGTAMFGYIIRRWRSCRPP